MLYIAHQWLSKCSETRPTHGQMKNCTTKSLLAPLNDYINLCNTGKQLQPTCNIFDKFPDLIIQGRNTTQINYDLCLKFMQILILFVFFFSFVSAEMSCSCSKTCVVKKMTKSCMKACNDYFSRKWWETNPLQIIS